MQGSTAALYTFRTWPPTGLWQLVWLRSWIAACAGQRCRTVSSTNVCQLQYHPASHSPSLFLCVRSVLSMHAPLHVKTHASMYARAISSKSRCVNDYDLSSPVSGKLFYDDPAIDRIGCGGGDVWMCGYVYVLRRNLCGRPWHKSVLGAGAMQLLTAAVMDTGRCAWQSNISSIILE